MTAKGSSKVAKLAKVTAVGDDTIKADSMCKIGATRVAKKIVKYWRNKGFTVRAWIEKMTETDEDEHAVWIVRSNLVNGLPAEFKKVAVAA